LLESRLSSTDESVTQSGAAMQINISKHKDELKKHWSEIRKLCEFQATKAVDVFENPIEFPSEISRLVSRKADVRQRRDAGYILRIYTHGQSFSKLAYRIRSFFLPAASKSTVTLRSRPKPLSSTTDPDPNVGCTTLSPLTNRGMS